jgi:hypothetical protein
MILIVTPTRLASDCVSILQQSTGEQVMVVQNFSEATTLLRSQPVTLAIFDQSTVEAEPHEAETARAHLETALTIEINLALTGIKRLTEEIQSVRKRGKRNEDSARMRAARSLQSELSPTLIALLLDCGLATNIQGLPCDAVERLSSIRTEVQKLRDQVASLVQASTV